MPAINLALAYREPLSGGAQPSTITESVTTGSVETATCQPPGEDAPVRLTESGTVLKLVSDKGFGFIQTGSGQELFFHTSEVAAGRFGELQVGQQVLFTTGHGPKGPRAEKVQPIDSHPQQLVPEQAT